MKGLWEFPGGKIEPKESSRQALARELEEEVGIVPQEVHFITQIVHAYADRKVALDIWSVQAFSGEVDSRENQPLQWVLLSDLAHLELLPASREILPFLLNRASVVKASWIDLRHWGGSMDSASSLMDLVCMLDMRWINVAV